MSKQGSAERPLSVSGLNQLAKELLETTLPALWIEGEVSNLSMQASGHWYLSLKDEQAQIRAAMFRGRNQSVRIKPRNGMHVRAFGRVSMYAPRGDYQFIIDRLEDAGQGALQRAFEQLRQKLQQEGLFDPALKRALPRSPRRIGLVTSPTGAAVHDILTVLERRCPLIEVVLYPALVQGNDAPAQLIEAINTANRRAEVDVLIVGRGGGSLEDLWAFNDEALARCIRASSLPVVSAVGHEVDFTIADFVADQRAPTPSAAAELLSPDISDWQALLQQQEARLSARMTRSLRDASRSLTQLQTRLKHPGRRLEEHHQRLDELTSRLQLGMQRTLRERHGHLGHLQARLKHPGTRLLDSRQRLDALELRLWQGQARLLTHHHARLERLETRLNNRSPAPRVAQGQERLSALKTRLRQQMQHRLQRAHQALARTGGTLNALSPLATLSRGYAIIKDSDGHILRDHTQVHPGERITAQLGDGALTATVTHTHPAPEAP